MIPESKSGRGGIFLTPNPGKLKKLYRTQMTREGEGLYLITANCCRKIGDELDFDRF